MNRGDRHSSTRSSQTTFIAPTYPRLHAPSEHKNTSLCAKVAELQENNTRLREQCDRSKREYLVALRKLARMPEGNSQDKDSAGRVKGRRGEMMEGRR